MSAYVVNRETIDRIVAQLDWDQRLIGASADNLLTGEPSEIGQRLWAMNVDAVNQRYNEQGAVPKYKYTQGPVSAMQACVSMRCLLYQCTEGNVPSTPLYQALTQRAGDLAFDLLRTHPDYTGCVWGS